MKKVLTLLTVSTTIFIFSPGSAMANNDLIDKKCSNCHTTQRIYSATGDQMRWDSTVARMKRYGLKLTADEEKQVKDYLYTLK